MMHRFLKVFVACYLALSAWGCNDVSRGNEILQESETAMAARDYPTTVEQAKRALEILRNTDDSLGIAHSNYLISRASAFLGEFENAVRYGEDGATVARGIGNDTLEYKINNTLSWSYFSLGRGFEETFDHYQRQIRLDGSASIK